MNFACMYTPRSIKRFFTTKTVISKIAMVEKAVAPCRNSPKPNRLINPFQQYMHQGQKQSDIKHFQRGRDDHQEEHADQLKSLSQVKKPNDPQHAFNVRGLSRVCRFFVGLVGQFMKLSDYCDQTCRVKLEFLFDEKRACMLPFNQRVPYFRTKDFCELFMPARQVDAVRPARSAFPEIPGGHTFLP